MNWSRSDTKTSFESLMGDSANAEIKWFYAEDDELAMGILEEPAKYKGHEVRIIFFMALPEQSDADDMLMIRVYDELLEIARNTDMLDAIARTQNYQELLRVLYKK